jgi:hypothetical protein
MEHVAWKAPALHTNERIQQTTQLADAGHKEKQHG